MDEKGKTDRKKLGKIVFASKENMDLLTNITWDYMQKILDGILEKEPDTIILEWALLPVDSKYWDKCDVKILMKANDEIRKNKVMERDNISEEYFMKRDGESLDYSNLKFDYVFENDYQEKTMEKIVNSIK